jgi:hypothetical protein
MKTQQEVVLLANTLTVTWWCFIGITWLSGTQELQCYQKWHLTNHLAELHEMANCHCSGDVWESNKILHTGLNTIMDTYVHSRNCWLSVLCGCASVESTNCGSKILFKKLPGARNGGARL